MSKQERQALALAKRAAEVEAVKDKELEAQRARDDLERKAAQERSSTYYQSGHNNNYNSSYNNNRNGYDDDRYGNGGVRDGRLDYGGRGGGAYRGARGGGDYAGRTGGRGGQRGGGGVGIGYNNGGGYHAGSGRGPAEYPSDAPTGPRGTSQRGGRGGGRGGYDERGYDRRDDRYGSGRRDDRSDTTPYTRPDESVTSSSAPPLSAAMDVDTAASSSVGTPRDSETPVPQPPSTDAPPPPTSAPPPPPPAQPSDEDQKPDIAQPAAPAPKRTLAEMAADNALAAAPAPLNAALNATRYLGAKVADKRKVSAATLLLSDLCWRLTISLGLQRTKIGGKKMDFDWDRTDDTGATEVDPLYAPYIAPQANRVEEIGGGRYGRDRDFDRSSAANNNNRHGQGNKPEDRRNAAMPKVTAVQGVAPRVGLFGRGQLAGFDKEVIPGRKM